MRAPILLLLTPAVCLGVVVLTSFVIFFALWRGKQAILQRMADEANADAGAEENTDTGSRWARADLAGKDQPNNIIEMAACPACGGESPASALACAYCGRKL